MQSVILSGPSECKIRRKYPVPPGFDNNYDNFTDPSDPLPLDEPEEESDPYLIWRRNAPFVYDSVSIYNLDWPSLVVEFMDDSKNFRVKNGSLTQRLLLGTHTSGKETEFAMVAELRTSVYSLHENLTTCENYNGFLSALKAKDGSLSPTITPNLEIKAKIVHPGEINRISHFPGSNFCFVTQGNNGTLYLFDYSKHPSAPRDLKSSHPRLVFTSGHSCEGYGISWNSSKKLASCASDGTLCLWDPNSKPSSTTKDFPGVSDNVSIVNPLLTAHHTSSGQSSQSSDKGEGSSCGFNDVEFLPNNDNLVLTACDDGGIYLVDFRHSPKFTNSTSLDTAVNCLSVNTFDPNYFVCGCENGNILLFDLRNPDKILLALEQHKDSVSQVEFNQSCCGLFASCSNDSTVCIFDLACTGEQLRFVHQGHKDQVNDISWAKLNTWQSAHVGFTLASVSQDNLLQCFTPNYFSL